MQTIIQKLDDQALLIEIFKQQPDWHNSLSRLLQRHHGALFARCYAYLRNREDAEDAAQETELRAFRAILNFRQDASFKTWLFTIGDRQCHDMVRNRSRHMLSEHLRSLIEIHEDNLTTVTQTGETRELVNKILTELPRRDREVILFRYYLDLPLREIAEYMGMGLSATKMRLYRSLELFKGVMQKQQRINTDLAT